MPSIARFSSHRQQVSRRRWWRHSFLGRVLGLALWSGVGGFSTGALIGVANWQSSGFSHPWWYWVGFTAPAMGVWMIIFGFLLGLMVFTGVGVASLRWKASRKARFSQQLKTGLFIPVAGSVTVAPLGAMFYWIVRQGGFTSPTSNLGDFVGNTAMATLVLSGCFFTLLLARSSQTKHPRRKIQVQTERLLPLD